MPIPVNMISLQNSCDLLFSRYRILANWVIFDKNVFQPFLMVLRICIISNTNTNIHILAIMSGLQTLHDLLFTRYIILANWVIFDKNVNFSHF